MIVTLARSEDAPRVAELAALGGADVDPAAELARVFAKLWVAKADADAPALGFLLSWDAADEVHLVDVVTHPEARRRGVGRALLGALFAHAARARASMIVLEVRKSNAPALGLYRSAGFHVVGVRARYYRDGEDAVLMRADLDPTSGLVLARDDEVELP